jgi:hypothetical protein
MIEENPFDVANKSSTLAKMKFDETEVRLLLSIGYNFLLNQDAKK